MNITRDDSYAKDFRTTQRSLTKFLIVDKKSFSAELPLTFTPDIMYWDKNLWVFNLSVTSTFWQKKAHMVGMEPFDLIQSILKELEIKTYVFSNSLWKGIALLYFMKSRDLEGMIDLSSPLGNKLFGQINWFTWFRFIESYGKQLQQIKRKGFNFNKFQKQGLKMRSTIKKLNLPHPKDLREVDENALQRRYGRVIAEMWCCLFGNKSEILDPWIPWKYKKPLNVKRVLEYSLNKWELMVPFIQNDLDKFLTQSNWVSGLQIVKFTWKVCFEDYGEITLPLEFRYPHDLALEKNHHQTALLLLEGALLKVSSSPVLTWEFEITDWMVIPDLILTIFGTEPSKESWDEQLIKLENKLNVPLFEYKINGDWNAIDGFKDREEKSPNSDPKYNLTWGISAKSRPIFIYPEPEPLKFGGELLFLERNMMKWWKKSPQKLVYQDYFKLTNKYHRSFWVSKDQNQNWWVHGVFG